ncbi:hypothetical protein [Corynebacterium atypicum]|uniref:hypothetical protein n=1 Tax=Corynebacterium atypicum TaxID=191610 RepID=UPI0011850343|nr:hypothetical protein [Corynebacterium atypicum]
MSLHLSIDADSATLTDLEALVAAARTAGAAADTRVFVDAEARSISLSAADPQPGPGGPRRSRDGSGPRVVDADEATERQPRRGNWEPIVGGVGEAAVRSVIDILTGREAPPRSS